MHKLTGFQRDLLQIISSEENLSGKLIKEKADSYYERDIHHGWIYHNLDELKTQNLIRKTINKHKEDTYELTEKGKQKIINRRKWENKNNFHLTDE